MKISNRKLFDMVVGGQKPVVRITKESNIPDLDCCFTNGMIGQIVDVDTHGKSNDPDMCYEFKLREDKFREFNKPYMDTNYFDDSRIPQLNYIQAGWAPRNGIESVFVMPQSGETDPADFELVDVDEESEFLSEFLESGESSYVKFLESLLKDFKDLLFGNNEDDDAEAWENQREVMFNAWKRKQNKETNG